jgi:hypothetical protein
MLRLPVWRWPFARPTTSGYCVLVFPDSTETRWFDRIPTSGRRLRSHGGHAYWGRTFVVDEVLQSGRNTYTVTLVDRREYLRNLRARSEGDLTAELLELARRTSETVNETRRRRRYRGYLP